MIPKIKRPLFIFVAGLALLIALLGLGLIPVNLFFVKPAISEAVLERAGVQLDIKGPLRLRLGVNPSLTASGISLHAPGSAGQPMAGIERLTIRPRLLKTLKGDLDLRSIKASGITVDEGFGQASGFLPKNLEMMAAAPFDGPLTVEFKGRKDGEAMTLAATGASLNSLLNDPEEYPLALRFNMLSSELRLDGSIIQPSRDVKLHAQLSVNAENVSELLTTLGLEVQGLDALSLHSKLRVSREEFRVEALTGELNEVAFTLSGLTRNFTSRPWFEIEAEFPQLDLAQFTDEEERVPADEKSPPTDLRFLFDGLSGFDGRAKLHVGRLLNTPIPFEDLTIEASLDHNRLSVDQAGLMLAGSEVAIQAALDAGLDCARLDTRLHVAGFDLAKLNPLLENEADLSGDLEELLFISSSCGVSLDEHIRSLQTSTAITGLYPSLGDEKLPLELSRMDAALNWSEPVEISLDGNLLGENLSATITLGSVAAIRSGIRSPLNISANGDAFTASMVGDGAIRNAKLELDVVLAADVLRMGALHRWLRTVPDNQLAFNGRSEIRLDDQGVSVSGLDVSLGRSDLQGRLSWGGPDSDKPMTANLKSIRLDFGELAGLFPAAVAPEEEADPAWMERLDETAWIERWFNFPAINIEIAVNSLEGVNMDMNHARLHAKLRDRLIQEGQLDLQFEGIDVAGTLDADFRQQPWTIDFESALSTIDLGRLLSALDLAENVDAQADYAKIHLVSEGNSLHELAVNSRLDSKIETLHWAFEAGPEQRRFDIYLSELELTTSPFSTSTWQTSGTLNGSPLKAWMQTPSLHTTLDPAADFPLRLVVGTGNDVTMLDMVIQHVSEEELRTKLEVSGAFLDAEGTDFASLTSPLDDYEFRTQLSVNESEYRASNIEARIGASKARGNVNIHREESGFRFDLDLSSPFLETDDLVRWTAGLRSARQEISSETVPDDPQENVNGGVLQLIDRYIDEFSGQNFLNVRVAVDELRSAGKLLGDAQLQLIIDGDEFRLDPVKITLPGGNVEARYSGTSIDGGFEYALDLNIDRLEYGGLLRLLDPDSKADGEVFMETSLVSRSPDAEHAIDHLQGHFDLAVFPEDIEAGFLDLWASNLIFALLPKGDKTGKKLNCLVARFDVENGVMTSKNTFLDSTDIIIRARGDIDLANRRLDLLVAPQAKLEKFLSVSTPIAVTGPFSDFRVGVAPGGFLTTMFRWYYGLVYVPWKWLTGERFPPDGTATCYSAMNWELPAH